jgi:superfamily II DNA or RNA helicase
MRGLCAPYSLGLSATPTRKDGLTRVMHWFLGPAAYTAQRNEMKHVTVEMVKYSCPGYSNPPPMTRFGTVNFAAVLTDMADDRTRTAVIVKHINRLRENPDRVVLVLSHRRDHCTDIAAQIPGAVAFLGGAKKRKGVVDTSHQTAPVVCATYALASEGYDDARLNALVLATPCSDVTQAAGRILRGSSTINPVIIDIQDDFSVAYAQAAKRKSYYRKAGFVYASEVAKKYPRCMIL